MTITFVLRQSVISTFCVEGTASCKILSAVEIQCYSIVKQSLTTQSVLGHHVYWYNWYFTLVIEHN